MTTDHLVADIPVKAFIRQDDKILFVKEPDGQFALPGGRMQIGELPPETLRREINEEIGLDIKVGDLLDCNVFTSKSGMHHFIVIFSAWLLGNVNQAKLDVNEVSSVDWVSLSDLSTLPVREEYRPILDRLAKKERAP